MSQNQQQQLYNDQISQSPHFFYVQDNGMANKSCSAAPSSTPSHYILMPIPMMQQQPSFQIPRVFTMNNHNNNVLPSLHPKSIPPAVTITPLPNIPNIRSSHRLYRPKNHLSNRERPFRSTIGIASGGDVNRRRSLPSELAVIVERNEDAKSLSKMSASSELSRAFSYTSSSDSPADNSTRIGLDKDLSPLDSAIYDVPQFAPTSKLPPLPTDHQIQSFQQVFFQNPQVYPVKSVFQPNQLYHQPHHQLPPHLDPSYIAQDSKRQFRELLKKCEKLERYEQKLKRGPIRRVCCSSICQLLWCIVTIIALGIVAYFVLMIYLI
uniref:Uncharacterized protein n=1 Tax=Rhabditophanes sp. KR3021 TaxID=114890 RepID=A0AC35U7T1_9BILA